MHLDLPASVKSLSLRSVLALPRPLQRILAGRPIVRQGQTLDLESQLVLRLQAITRTPILGEQSVEDGRRLLLADARVVGGHHPIGSVTSMEVAGMRARLYVPAAATDALLVFFHGGAWIYGDLDSHDASCRFLAERAGVRVLAIDYRLAPEQPFPAAYDDCVAAYRWVTDNAARLGASVDRLAVGGDSAGGNLAAATALAAARDGLPLAFQLLVYPATDFVARSESREEFSSGFYLTETLMDLGADSYVPDRGQRDDPRASPLYADIPSGLAPAYVCTAGFDPLRDEGEAYAEKMRAAGVAVELERFDSLIHGFFNWVGTGRTAPAAVERIAERLAAGLAG